MRQLKRFAIKASQPIFITSAIMIHRGLTSRVKSSGGSANSRTDSPIAFCRVAVTPDQIMSMRSN